MKTNQSRIKLTLLLSLGFVIISGVIAFVTSAASFPTILGVGNMPFSEFQGGPCHTDGAPTSDHTGDAAGGTTPAGTITPELFLSVVGTLGTPNQVNQGSVTIEDGCGGEETFAPGQAFEQIGGRVHRAKNLSGQTVEEHNMFINPQGTPLTRNLTQRQCGPPKNEDECKRGGWMKFDFPRSFRNRGDCIRYVLQRPSSVLTIPGDPLEIIPELKNKAREKAAENLILRWRK